MLLNERWLQNNMRVVFLFITKSKTNENFTSKLEAYEDYMLLKLKK